MMIKSNSVNSKITKIEPNWEPRLIQSRKLSKLKSFNKIKLITKYLSYTHTIHNLEQDLQEIQKELYGLENIKIIELKERLIQLTIISKPFSPN